MGTQVFDRTAVCRRKVAANQQGGTIVIYHRRIPGLSGRVARWYASKLSLEGCLVDSKASMVIEGLEVRNVVPSSVLSLLIKDEAPYRT